MWCYTSHVVLYIGSNNEYPGNITDLDNDKTNRDDPVDNYVGKMCFNPQSKCSRLQTFLMYYLSFLDINVEKNLVVF